MFIFKFLRNYIYKHRIGFGLLFGLEAIISMISIPISIQQGNDSFSRWHKHAYYSSNYQIEQIMYQFGFGDVSNPNKIMNHSKTKKSLENILDLKKESTEIGGIVFLRNDKSGKYFDFIYIPSENEKTFQNLERKEHLFTSKDGCYFLKDFYFINKNNTNISNSTLLNEIISNYSNNCHQMKNDIRKKKFYLIKDIYKRSYQYNYFLHNQIKYLASKNISFGRIYAGFHIHPHGAPPSINDQEIAKEFREFVIIKNRNFIKAWRLNKNKPYCNNSKTFSKCLSMTKPLKISLK